MIDKVKIEVTGKNPDYFLKEILKKKINIYDLEKKVNKLIVIIDYKSYLVLKDIKTTYTISIIRRYGLNRLKFLILKYVYLLMFLIIGIIINIILSNMIFKIEVVNPNKEIRNIIIKDLKDLGVRKYRFKLNYQERRDVLKRLKQKERELIDWIEIEEVGTKYIVRLEQKKIKKDKKKCLPRSIIAKKNALITDIYASDGEVVKKINDYVVKNEVLISGLIHNKEDIVSKRCARGMVYGEVWYRVKINIPEFKIIKKDTDDKKISLEINFLKNKYNNKDSLNIKKTSYNIIDSKIIPINYSVVKLQKQKLIYKPKSDKEIDKKALSTAKDTIIKRLGKGDKIISKKVLKKVRKNSKIEVEVFVSTRENIVSYTDISNIDINKMNKKEE